MRRILLTLMLGGALAALVPATALAAHHHGKAHHQARHHARRHSRVRFEQFGSAPSSSTQPAGENEQNAGTVTSFQNGTLTITLNDGSTVSGTVTPNTEIECRAEDTSANMQRDDHGDRGDQGDQGDQGDDNGNDNGDNANENGEQEHGQQNCSSTNLTQGTVVREAELKVTGSGANWDKVDLVTSQAGVGDNDNDNDGTDS
jgi:hypothetical protein